MEQPLGLTALSTTCSLVSMSASGWLLFALWRLPEAIQRKLFALQLWHLALADAAAFSCFAAKDLHKFVSHVSGVGGADASCILESAGAIGIITSSLFEAHIALAAVLKTFRLTSGLKILERLHGFVWCVGITVGALDVYITGAKWSQEYFHCHPVSGLGVEIKNVCLVASFGFCVVAYAVGFVG